MSKLPVKVINKKEYAYWKQKIKLLSPKEGDILVVPAEAQFDFATLAEVIKLTPIKFALVVPGGDAKLLVKEDAIKFAEKILKGVN